ncbi:MAG TPA: hypothetical protein VFA89_20920 [Terriglobales bacterium]|nr:hypothetical protein [Terriglobales bacterium]
MNERILKTDGSDSRWCDQCKCELAATEVTDAIEQADGTWQESAPRRGCLKHPVVSMVRFRNGAVTTFEEYKRHSEQVQ